MGSFVTSNWKLQELMGEKIRTTRFLEVAEGSAVTVLRCLFCRKDLVTVLRRRDVEAAQMENLMKHMFWLHEVSRQDLVLDFQEAVKNWGLASADGR